MTTFKIPKPEHLTEQETLTSFKKWQKNILFHLSVRNEFAAFIEPTFTWQKSSTTNRGLTDDPQTTENRKTALQKNIVLEQMLGLIAQFAPDLLNNEIVNKSVSLNWIWNRIRKHYSFSHSEVNFLKINSIKRETSERYETFYQRIVAHVEDNLLTVESGIEHDGAVLTADEHMSPTVERLIVNMWLNQIDSRLAAYVGRVYAHDLQKRSLKDIQPLICEAMDELLAELNAQEDAHVNVARSSYNSPRDDRRASFFSNNRNQPHGQPFRPSQQQRQQQRHVRFQLPSGASSSPQSQLVCILCKLVGRTYLGHDVRNCFHISRADRTALARSLDVSYDGEDESDDHGISAEFNQLQVDHHSLAVTAEVSSTPSVQRVSCHPSPFFFCIL